MRVLALVFVAILFVSCAFAQAQTTMNERNISRAESEKFLRTEVSQTITDFNRGDGSQLEKDIVKPFQGDGFLREAKLGDESESTTCSMISTRFGKKQERGSFVLVAKYRKVALDQTKRYNQAGNLVQSRETTSRDTYLHVRDIRLYLLPLPLVINKSDYYIAFESYHGPYRGPNDRVLVADPSFDPMGVCIKQFAAEKALGSVYEELKAKSYKAALAEKARLEKQLENKNRQ